MSSKKGKGKKGGKKGKGKKGGGLTWADIDEALKSESIPGVPTGTDLEEFLWQTIPESRKDIEARNPGRTFKPAGWAKKLGEQP